MRRLAILAMIVGIVVGGLGVSWFNGRADAQSTTITGTRILSSICLACTDTLETGNASAATTSPWFVDFAAFLDQQGCTYEWQVVPPSQVVVLYHCVPK